MTTLTPSEIEEIREHDHEMRGHAGSTLTPAMMDRGKLLRHIDALAEERKTIVERLETIRKSSSLDYHLQQFVKQLRGES